MTVRSGTTFGPYTILGSLGAGGMGEVYRAKDARIGREVAIKILPPSYTNNSEMLLRFQQEAKAAGMLNHPNLLSIFDVGAATDGAPYIVSELLEGETLRDRLNQPLPVRKAIEIALQMAQGLAAAHEKGIIHRDLKPENVFVTRDGRVKILDFGLAKLNPQIAGDGPTFRSATEPGMVMGTVGYMSPEQVRGEVVDHRSDIFSFGAILYEMFAGNRAFRKESSIETMSAILKEDPPDLMQVHPGLSPALDRIIRRCLEKNREQRFQSARDLAFHLECLPPTATMSVSPSSAAAAQATGAPRTPPPRTAAGREPVPRSTTEMRAPTERLPEQTQSQAAVSSTTASRMPTQARPLPTSAQRVVAPPPKTARKTTTILLLTLLGLTLATGGFFAAKLTSSRGVMPPPEFNRITFRRGEVKSARFAADGDTLLYSAAWDGGPTELYLARRTSPEAKALDVRDADVLSISKNDEVALLLRRDRLTGLGTLARMPMVGGTPREVQNDVLQADFSPDGANLAVIRKSSLGFQLEYPLGTVLYDTQHYIRDPRVSPDGSMVAFLEPHSGAFDIVVHGKDKQEPIARGWSRGVTGLAWSADGSEILLTGTESHVPPALYGVTLDGDVRVITRLTGGMKLWDISRDGRVLVTHNNWRAALILGRETTTRQTPAAAQPVVTTTIAESAPAPVNTEPAPALEEHDYSWLDWSIACDVSRDGSVMIFTESREGGGRESSVYLRRTDGGTPIRLGNGFADALSPDGKWVLSHQGSKLVLLPTGAGEPKEIAVQGSFDQGGVFMPDGKSVLLAGVAAESDYAVYQLDLETAKVRRVTPTGISGGAFRPFALSPDATTIAALNAERRLVLYPMGGGRPAPVAVAQPEELPVAFSPDGSAIYVYNPREVPVDVFEINLVTGNRRLLRTFRASDPAGVYKMSPVIMTPDAKTWVYNSLRSLSDLYVLEWPAETR